MSFIFVFRSPESVGEKGKVKESEAEKGGLRRKQKKKKKRENN